MFDTIGGIPLHPLVVHAVVVLGPLAGLLLLAYVFKPSWRVGLRWPTLALAVISAASAAMATSSGESLEEKVGDPAFDHAERGDLAAASIYVLTGVAIVVILFLLRAGAEAGKLTAVAAVLAILAVGFSWFGIFEAGHTGASSVWKGDTASSSSSSGDSD